MKAVKWISIIVGGLIVLVVLILLIVPQFVDVQKYKPEIEKRVADATGRPFKLGGDISLSLFPWAGVSLSDLHLGNPEGFQEKDFLSIKTFEVRVKLLPLLSKNVQIKRFLLAGPRIALEKTKDGRVNWEGLGKPSGEAPKKTEEKKEGPSAGKPGFNLPIQALVVGDFAVTDGTVLWVDQTKGERREVSEMTLRLKDVSLENPITLAFSAKLDGKPLSLQGSLGPIGKAPGLGDVSLDLTIKAFDQLNMALKGKLAAPAIRQEFDLSFDISPFSPRKVFKALGQEFPVSTADPKVLEKVALKAKLKGNPKNIAISEGTLNLDESKLLFSLQAKEFNKPDVAFDLNIDAIDLDRYMPPPAEKEASPGGKKSAGPKPAKEKIDYAPLRKMVIDGSIRVGKLKAQGVNIQDLTLKVAGKNGIIKLDPLALKLYEGTMSVNGVLNVQKDSPRTNATLRAEGIQVAPIIKDFMEKDFLEGTLKSNIDIRMEGDDPERIKRTLNGQGDLIFNDGAIVGIDIAGMARNVKAKFGLGEPMKEKPRTDFSEFSIPFTITNGLVNTPNTRLMSPLLRVTAKGNAHLVREDLDFRVEPKFVGTLKGQGDASQRSGITVPILVSGTFSEPKFRPDLEGMLKQDLGKQLQPSELLKGQGDSKDSVKGIEEKAKGLLKGLPFGN